MSSSADSTDGPQYRVSSRNLARDLSHAEADASARELGALSATSLEALLQKLTALDPTQFGEADPHLIVTARRGRFAIRPERGQVRVQTVGDAAPTFLTLAPSEVPAWLDSTAVAAATPGVSVPAYEPKRRISNGGAVAFLVLCLVILGVSAYLTFRPGPVVP